MTYFINQAFIQQDNSSLEIYYQFIQKYDVLPSKERIIQAIKQSRDAAVAVNEVNSLYAKALKRALLSQLDKEQARPLKNLLTVKFDIDQETLATTQVKVKYGDIEFTNPLLEQLNYLCEILQRDAKLIWFNGVYLSKAIQMNIPTEVATKIKEVVEEGICEPIVDSSGGNSQTLIIELEFIADMATTNSNFYEYQEHIWQVLKDHNEVLGDMRKFNPSFLVLYASDEN